MSGPNETTLQKNLVMAFGTPVLSYAWPDSQEFDRALTDIILAAEEKSVGVMRSNVGGWHSSNDLLEWDAEPVQQLCAAILRGVWSTVAAVTTMPPERLQTLSMQARAGFTIVQPDGCMPATSHSLTAWCGLCCLQAPAPTAERVDSGGVRFYESRLSTMMADASGQPKRWDGA